MTGCKYKSQCLLILAIIVITALDTVTGLLHDCNDKNSTEPSESMGSRCRYGPFYPISGGGDGWQRSGPSYPQYPTVPQAPFRDYRGNWPYPQTQMPPYYYPIQPQPQQAQQPGGYGYPPWYYGPGSVGAPIYGPPTRSNWMWPQQPYPQQPYPQQPYPPSPYPQQPYPPYMQRRSQDPPQPKQPEPKYLGQGSLAMVSPTDVEMSCAFHDQAIKMASNVVWVKVTGPYDVYQATPPFQCTMPGCDTVHLNAANDFRYRVITAGQTSILRIYDANPSDMGVYRCAATGVDPTGAMVTLYRVIPFTPPQQSQPPYYGRRRK